MIIKKGSLNYDASGRAYPNNPRIKENWDCIWEYKGKHYKLVGDDEHKEWEEINIYNQIIDEVYETYLKGGDIKWLKQVEVSSTPLSSMVIPIPYTQEEFINKCKTDQEFSERWGLKIEEQILTEERRYNIWFNNNYETGMERFFNPEQLPDYDNPYYQPTPTKEITIIYNGEKIEVYE